MTTCCTEEMEPDVLMGTTSVEGDETFTGVNIVVPAVQSPLRHFVEQVTGRPMTISLSPDADESGVAVGA